MKGLEALENLCNQCEFYQFEKGLRPKKCPFNKNCVHKCRIEKELEEAEANKNASEILRIIFNAPYILETLMKRNELGKSASDRYLWGSITDEEVKKIKEFFSDGKI